MATTRQVWRSGGSREGAVTDPRPGEGASVDDIEDTVAEHDEDRSREEEPSQEHHSLVGVNGGQDWDWNADTWDSWHSYGGQGWWQAQGSSWSWNGRGSESWYDDAWSWRAPRQIEGAARLEETTRVQDGKWQGSQYASSSARDNGVSTRDGGDAEDGQRSGRPTEKLTVPEFTGEGAESELGRTARSYIRKVTAWLRCTKMPVRERAIALYTNLAGRAWVFAEELDVDRLADIDGVDYFLDWIRVRFMEMEVTKVSNVMAELFRKCKKRGEQSVRDFNIEFERLMLHLKELDCELPGLVKAWLYLDKLRLNETEEMSLLSSVQNKYDVKLLQQAAIVHDKSYRRTWEKSGSRWTSSSTSHGGLKHVHVTANENGSEDEEDDVGGDQVSDADLVAEDVAQDYHSAYMAFQDAKSRYKEALKGRGVDRDELRKRSEERLRMAKMKSYCAACQRKRHWHKDPECPLRGKSASGGGESVKQANECHHVQMCYMVGVDSAYETVHQGDQRLLAITDTACTKTVAGHAWFENYCKLADDRGWPVEIVEEEDKFRFGASRVHVSKFAVWCHFGIEKVHFQVKVAVVQCDVPLLFSRSVLGKLGMVYHVDKQRADLSNLGLKDVPMPFSATGHPGFVVSDFSETANCLDVAVGPDPEVRLNSDVRAREQYMAESSSRDVSAPIKPLFYPKKISLEVHNLLVQVPFSPVSFIAWWKHADQSRDFWIETKEEFIRVHMVPRKGGFNPAKWSTSLQSLKSQLLGALPEWRITEAVQCHGEGLIEEFEHSRWRSCEAEGQSDVCHGALQQLWIGRSRFVKHGPKTESPRFPNAIAHFTMADEPSTADGGVGGIWGGHSPKVDGAGVASDSDRTTCREMPKDGEQDCRPQQEEPGRLDPAGQGGGLGDSQQANAGIALEDDPRSDGAARRARDNVREVQELDVPRGAGGVHGLGHQRGQSEPELVTGPANWAKQELIDRKEKAKKKGIYTPQDDPEVHAVVEPPDMASVVSWKSSRSGASTNKRGAGYVDETPVVMRPDMSQEDKDEMVKLQTQLAMLQQKNQVPPGSQPSS
eukprot:s358_g31.t1